MTRYGMAIDLNRCFGCQACAAACKIANNMPKDVNYNIVYTQSDKSLDTLGLAVATGAVSNDCAGGTHDDPVLSFFPMQCQHCKKPACLDVCPTGATVKDEETGIVSVDSELCIGCESCIKACPYEGVRTLIKSPEYYLDVVVGEYDAPPHKAGTVEKCTFCKNLIDRDEVPACMQLCPGRARYWGDLDDPESAVSKAIEGREVLLLQEDAGTEPSVYYLQ